MPSAPSRGCSAGGLLAVACATVVALVHGGGCDRAQAEHRHTGPFVEIVAASNHTCALAADGAAQCWGGDDSVLPQWRTTPTDRFSTIATDQRFACGVRKDDGHVLCWGDCAGEACSPPAGRFARVVLGPGGGCALDETGHASCWGQPNPERQRLTPEVEAASLRDLRFGYGFALAILADGTVRAWSGNPPDQYTRPLLDGVPEGAFRRVVSNTTTACALREPDGAVCWSNKSAPDAPSVTSLPVVDLDLHHKAGCAIVRTDAGRARGSVTCTGIDGRPRARELERVAVGRAHACALDSDGAVTCWGDDKFGQASGRAPNRWLPTSP